MSKQLEQKRKIVDEISAYIKDAKALVLVDYRGINVKEDTKLRNKFRENNVIYKVYKNRLLKRAFDELGITGYDPTLLEGTTSVAFSPDEVSAARIFSEAIKEYKKMEIKFGLLNGAVVSKEEVIELSKLPTKPVLISMLLGMLQAPVSGLARALNEISKKEQA